MAFTKYSRTHSFSTLRIFGLSLSIIAFATLSQAQPQAPAPANLNRLENLGSQIFKDKALSEPRGTACNDCHLATSGFAGNNGSRIGVAQGSTPQAIGGRNAMSNAYTSFTPKFQFRVTAEDVDPVGGFFWDGR